MEKSLKQYTEDAIWVAKTLFDRNKATIYIDQWQKLLVFFSLICFKIR